MTSEIARKKRNEEIIRKMKSGESLAAMSTEASWFPPRPIIKKDKDALEVLFERKE